MLSCRTDISNARVELLENFAMTFWDFFHFAAFFNEETKSKPEIDERNRIEK
jgi:hypothetical protein